MAAFAKSWRREGSTALGVSAGAVRRALRAPETAAMQKKKSPAFQSEARLKGGKGT